MVSRGVTPKGCLLSGTPGSLLHPCGSHPGTPESFLHPCDGLPGTPESFLHPYDGLPGTPGSFLLRAATFREFPEASSYRRR